MVRAEFVDRKGFKFLKVLDGQDAPPFYSFALLPPYTTENWFSNGWSGDAEVQIDHLLFRLKREVNGIALYEEIR